MIKTRILPIFLAAVLTVCANTTALSATVYAAEQDSQVSADNSTDDSMDESTGQKTDASGSDQTVDKSSSEQDEKETQI